MKPLTAREILAALKAAYPRGKFPPLKQWAHLMRLADTATMVRDAKPPRPMGSSTREVKGRIYLKLLVASRLALPPEFQPYENPGWLELEQRLAALVGKPRRARYK